MQSKKLIKVILVNVFLLLTKLSDAQNINGFVRDAVSGESLIGVTVHIENSLTGTNTNNYGFFSLSVSIDTASNIIFSYVGYADTIINSASFKNNNPLTVQLSRNAFLPEVIVTDKGADDSNNKIDLNMHTVKSLPSLGGETDVLKAITLFPGIKRGKEGTADLSVRGGAPDENLILMDEVPLYYINHLGGFVSVFDPEAINNITLWKGNFPARYGGRLSSVIDVHFKNGNTEKLGGVFSISPLLGHLMLNGPIKNSKTTFLISGRKFFFDLLSKPITKFSLNGVTLGYTFFDLTGKINHQFNKRLSGSIENYFGNDILSVSVKRKTDTETDFQKVKYNWGNVLLSAKLNYTPGAKLFWNNTIYYVQYHYGLSDVSSSKGNISSNTDIHFSSGIKDAGWKSFIEWSYNHHFSFSGGMQFVLHHFTPGTTKTILSINNSNSTVTVGSSSINNIECRSFAQLDFKFGNKIKGSAGLNTPLFIADTIHLFFVEPRINLQVELNKNNALEASYTEMQQQVHLVSSSGSSSFPIDLWLPSTPLVAPESAIQYSFGFKHETKNGMFHFATDFYYKTLSNLITYKEGRIIVGSNIDWQYLIETKGKGTCYGGELLISKSIGKNTGWISYSYSRSFRQFENINHGKNYPYVFDRPHEGNIVFNHHFNEHVNFSATWMISSGSPITLAEGKYNSPDNYSNNWNGNYFQTGATLEETFFYAGKNRYRTELYHKLDVAMQFQKQKKNGERTWSISIYNVYCRFNAFFYRYEVNSVTGVTELHKVALFPFIPSIGYSRKF